MSYQNVKLLSDYINNVKNQTGAPFSKETNKKYVPTNAMEERIKKRMGVILLAYSPEQLEAELASAKSSMEGQMKMANVDADSLRRAVVGDNPLDLSMKDLMQCMAPMCQASLEPAEVMGWALTVLQRTFKSWS
jgi:hypothetical protein